MTSLALGKVIVACPGFADPDIPSADVGRVGHTEAARLARAIPIPHRHEATIRGPES